MIKKTASKAKVVKKAPLKKAIVKKSVAVKKTVSRPTKSAALEIKSVVKARPSAKTIEKTANVTRDAPKSGVRMAKRIQTAEGWKQEQIKQHRAKKTKP